MEHTLITLDKESRHDNKYKIHKVLNATKQVVAGILYRVTAEIIVSDCAKTSKTKPSDCGVLKESNPQVCSIEIWDRKWLPDGRQVKTICDGIELKFRNRRSVDEDYQEIGTRYCWFFFVTYYFNHLIKVF